MTTAAPKPIQQQVVEPAADREVSSQRPTETRYGWCPFGDIFLFSPSGTPSLYVQPHSIETMDGNIENPYHRTLPKGQLIPFPTFNAVRSAPSPDQVDSNGRAILITTTRTVTALEAATSVLRAYSGWGFIILNSLQGIDQAQANRIFAVVHPFEYPIADLENELIFGAAARIDATEPIKFKLPDGSDYVVQQLRDEFERDTARHLAEEMEGGASIAAALANLTLDDTEASMTQKYAGGNGKSGPDPLDRRLSSEMHRELPQLIGSKKENDLAELKGQMDFLVGREASRADKEKIVELEAKIAAMESATATVETAPPAETISSEGAKFPPIKMSEPVTVNGRRGKILKPSFGKFEIEFEDGEVEKIHRSEITQ